MYKAFGCPEKNLIIGFLICQGLFLPLETLLEVAMNKAIRTMEYQADAFAHRFGRGDN